MGISRRSIERGGLPFSTGGHDDNDTGNHRCGLGLRCAGDVDTINAITPGLDLSRTSGAAIKRHLTPAIILLFAFAIFAVFLSVRANDPADFEAFYNAGLRFRHGFDLYDARAYPDARPWIRLPFEVLLFAPFSFLSYRAAYFAWALVNMGCLGLSIWLTDFRTLGQNAKLAFVLLMALPIAATLGEGQDTGLLALLVILAVVALDLGRDARAGFLLALCLIKFLLLIPAVLFLILRQRRKVLRAFTLTGCWLFLISTAIAGVNWPARYLITLRTPVEWQKGRLISGVQYVGQSWEYFVAFSWGHPELAWPISVLLLLGALAATWNLSDRDGLMMTITAAALFTPHTGMANYVVAAVGIIFLLHRCFKSATPAAQAPKHLRFEPPPFIGKTSRWAVVSAAADEAIREALSGGRHHPKLR